MRPFLLVLAAALAAFGASLAGSFHFDDYALFTDPAITSPHGWIELWGPLHTRPLTWLTFWLNYQAGGTDPLGYHVVNLLLHAACAVLALRVLSRLLPAPAALAAALVFAVHPIQAEAVNYVFARSSLVMTLACLLALDAWVRGRRWIAVAWFAAALLAKEECVTFPLFLLLLERGGAAWRRPVAAMLGLAGAAGLRTLVATSLVAGSGAGAAAGISPIEYASMQGVAILRYARLLILPWGYSVDPDLGAPAYWLRVGAGVVVAAVCGLAWWRREREPEWRWLAGGLVLVAASSSIFPAADLAADRRLYLPMLSLAAAAGLLLARRRWLVATAVLVLAAVSIRYSLVWRSEESLWREAVARAPAKARPKRQLARVSAPADALRLLREARSSAPDDPGVASDLGRLYLRGGRPDLALAEFGRELALAPSDPAALADRASALEALGDRATAISEYQRVLGIDPCFADAHYALRRLGVAPAAPPAEQCRWSAEVRALILDARP